MVVNMGTNMRAAPGHLNDGRVTEGDIWTTAYPIDLGRLLAAPAGGASSPGWTAGPVHFPIGLHRRPRLTDAEGVVLPAFRFGRFELYPAARELRKDGVRMRLQDQPFELLSLLLERPGEVLTRDELRQRLWPQGMFVDFEHGLNAAVKRVRSALGDDADNPRFVETLRGRGYRFVGSVEAHDRAGSTSPARSPSRLAVLPFTDLGEPSAPRFFTDGLTDEMITRVGRLFAGRVRIITRSSSLLAQRNATTARQIGAALRVQFVVEGRVRRSAVVNIEERRVFLAVDDLAFQAAPLFGDLAL